MDRESTPERPQGASARAVAGDEDVRALALAAYGLDALQDDPELAAIAAFAARLCGTPIALVSLVEEERERFLARAGTDALAAERNHALCAMAMNEDGIVVVPDAGEDARFRQHSMVSGDPYVRFYAAAPLVSETGIPLGTLCVMATEPRAGLDDIQREGLSVLAAAVMRRFKARRSGGAARAQIDLRDQRLRVLADSMPQIAWSADRHGNVDYFNARFAKYTGVTPTFHGDDWRVLIHPDDVGKASKAWNAALKKGGNFQAEYRLRRADGTWLWMLARALPVRNAEGDVDRWYGTITDIDESRRLAEANDLIARELNHRIKNIFALIIGLVTMSARGAPEAAEFAASLAQRVRALDHAHGFVRADAAGEMVADGGLHTLLRTLFSPYDRAEGPAIEITGTDFTILRGATPLALVFHELATNAVKYGALSEEHGRVSVKTWADGENAVMEWSEFGGPVVKDRPKPTGFGSRLVEMSVKNQLGGTIVYSWQRDGLRATIRCPLEQL